MLAILLLAVRVYARARRDLLPVNDIFCALLKKLDWRERHSSTHTSARACRESRAERSVGGSTTSSWLQFWVMCAGMRNGDYHDGSPFQRITWYFLILGTTGEQRRVNDPKLLTRIGQRIASSFRAHIGCSTAIRIGRFTRTGIKNLFSLRSHRSARAELALTCRETATFLINALPGIYPLRNPPLIRQKLPF